MNFGGYLWILVDTSGFIVDASGFWSILVDTSGF